MNGWLLRATRLGMTAAGFATGLAAQGPGPWRPGAYLYVLDLAGTPVGEFPTSLRMLKGTMEVVRKDGQPMLKASAASEFVIPLPAVLPEAFTMEFELIPKACCNPQDLSFEGTPAINQGPASAHILWDSDGSLAVIGGGPSYETPMPEELKASLPGVLTSVVVVVEGTTLRLYTNGRRLWTLTDRKFARGRAVRVFLGGQDDGAQAVYLAGLRIGSGAVAPGVVAAGAGGPVRPGGAGVTPPTSTTSASTGTLTNPGSTVQAAGTGKIATTDPGTGTASGTTSLPARTMPMPGFTATGGFGTLAPRTVALPGFTGTGGFTALAPRQMSLPAFTGTGGYIALAPRTVALPGFTGAGSFGALPARTLALPGFIGAGSYIMLAPRAITLPAFTGTGNHPTLAPRTITLPGWTAAGVTP